MTTPDPAPPLDSQLHAVLTAALAVRPPLPLQQAPAQHEAAAFARAVTTLAATLQALPEPMLENPARGALSARQLIGHIIGTQHVMAATIARALGSSVADDHRAADHMESTRHEIDLAANMTLAELTQAYTAISASVVEQLAGIDEADLSAHAEFAPLRAELRTVLTARVFELWTHDDDLRLACGLPTTVPDDDQLWYMTRLAVPLTRFIADPGIRVVLTGAGGGVWPAMGTETANIVIDAVGFCRRVADRAEVDELDADITGDADVAEHFLHTVARLALD